MKLSKNYLRKVIKESIGQVKQAIREEEEEQQQGGDTGSKLPGGVNPQMLKRAEQVIAGLLSGRVGNVKSVMASLQANDAGRLAMGYAFLDAFGNMTAAELEAMPNTLWQAMRSPESEE